MEAIEAKEGQAKEGLSLDPKVLQWCRGKARWIAWRYGADKDDVFQSLCLEHLKGRTGRRAVSTVIRSLVRHEFPRYGAPELPKDIPAKTGGLSLETIEWLAETLNESEWLVVEMNILRGWSYQRVADSLQVHPNTVKNCKRSALEKLRQSY